MDNRAKLRVELVVDDCESIYGDVIAMMRQQLTAFLNDKEFVGSFNQREAADQWLRPSLSALEQWDHTTPNIGRLAASEAYLVFCVDGGIRRGSYQALKLAFGGETIGQRIQKD